jgi:hypothetical protein
VVSKCIAAGLVGGEGFSIDASLIKADAGRKQRVPGDEPIAWPRAEEASRAGWRGNAEATSMVPSQTWIGRFNSIRSLR